MMKGEKVNPDDNGETSGVRYGYTCKKEIQFASLIVAEHEDEELPLLLLLAVVVEGGAVPRGSG